MNTINNKFSFSRFAAVLKCDLMENWVRYVGVFAILFFANLAYQLVDIKDVVELSTLRALPVEEYMKQLAIDCVPLFYGVLSLSLMCAAADMTTVPFKTKGRALNYLMIPATKLEKFLSRAFINVVLVLMMAYVALFLADLARLLYVGIFDIEGFYGFTIPKVFVSGSDPFVEIYKSAGQEWGTVEGLREIVSFNPTRGFIAASWLGVLVLLLHSLFILGGCIWRKAAIIKTLATGLAIIFITVWLVEEFNLGDLFTEDWLKWYFSSYISRVLTYSLLLLPIFNWWLSYRLFSRKQMIPRTHLFGSKHPHHLFNKAHS